MEHKLILFIDSGDTLINEATEIRNAEGVVIQADLIDGAKETLRSIRAAGYRIALVADGLNQSFINMYTAHSLRDCFDAWAVSELVGECKPSPRMFQTAFDQLGLSTADKSRVIMVGNNLSRDIAGANRFGLTSVFFDWSPRYPHSSQEPDEVPDYTIHSLPGLLPLLASIRVLA
ncbi:MAG: HAD family hydrolase [Treponema sp.]|jgi:putative hydrolase of the HAD superfamily|nr:HAD family hydrolase [Treponema sp.]